MEIQGHSRNHDGLAHSGALYTITKTGETVNIDRTSDTITISNTGSVNGFKEKSLNAISSELVALGATVSALPSSYVNGISMGEIMADSAGPQQSPYVTQMLIDPTGDTGYLYSELVSAASDLASTLGVSINIVAPPYGDTNDIVKNVCEIKGFRACRAGSDWALDNIDLQNIIYFSVPDLLGSDDAETVSKVRTFANEVSIVGGVVSILSHATSEATMHDWELILDTLKNEFPEINVTKMSTAIDAVRDSGLWTTSDNRRYSRIWNDSSANFNLSWDSDLIDMGTSTDLAADFVGNPIYGTRDIGAYEYQPPFTLGTDKIDPTGNIRIYGDSKYRYTTATSSSMSAYFSVAPAESWTYAASTTRPEWLNISNITWTTTKQWTASSSNATTTIYTVGDLTPNAIYVATVDSATTTSLTGSTCSSGICTSSALGKLTLTYTGGYSTHTFAVTPDTTLPTVSLDSPVTDATITGSITLSATASDNVAVSSVQFKLDGVTDIGSAVTSPSSGSTYTTTWDPTGVSSMSHTLFAVAKDSSGNYATSTVVINVDNSSSSTSSSGGGGNGPVFAGSISSLPNYIPPRPTTIYPDGTTVYGDATTTSNNQNNQPNQTPTTPTTNTPNITTTPTPFSFHFTRDLQLWDRGEDVRQLQIFLNTHGFILTDTGYGAPGNETSTFGYLTLKALIKFQKANNITPTHGYFGPITRGVVGRMGW